MAILITPDGIRSEVFPAAGKKKHFTIEELYKLIGCDTVEHLSMDGNRSMWIDENGKFAAEPKHNLVAEMVLRDSLRKMGRMLVPGDYLVGNVVICEEDEDLQ